MAFLSPPSSSGAEEDAAALLGELFTSLWNLVLVSYVLRM